MAKPWDQNGSPDLFSAPAGAASGTSEAGLAPPRREPSGESRSRARSSFGPEAARCRPYGAGEAHRGCSSPHGCAVGYMTTPASRAFGCVLPAPSRRSGRCSAPEGKEEEEGSWSLLPRLLAWALLVRPFGAVGCRPGPVSSSRHWANPDLGHYHRYKILAFNRSKPL